MDHPQPRRVRFLAAVLLICAGSLSACTGSSRDDLSSAQRLRRAFPDVASTILSPGAHLLRSDVPAPQPEARTEGHHHRTGVRATFPEVANGAVRFELPGDFVVDVIEAGASGRTEFLGDVVAFAREGGRSWWTPTRAGFEEWLHLEPGVARGNVVARWEVRGARLVQRADAVELLDEAGDARMRVTAPVAHAIDGGPVALKLLVEGQALSLWVDARGEEVLVDPLWESTGAMASGRYWHAATLLHSGKVLVTGGNTAQKTAELYDPTTGLWSPTGEMTYGRDMHAQVVLQNGKVLVCGGQGPQSLASAELYDPATGTWSPTGSLKYARHAHSATLLADGRVLIAGGYSTTGDTQPSVTAEVYDPVTGTWTLTGRLVNARSSHTGVLLKDGRVLLSGGGVGAAAEIYDPTTNAWTAAAPMKSSRFDHALLLLPDGRVLASGGRANFNLASAELYDPGTDAWTATGSMAAARRLHTATLLPDGSVLVTGGEGSFVSGGSPLSAVELFDPAKGTWTAAGALQIARERHMATLLSNGKVLVTGGRSAVGQLLKTAELFDPVVVTAIPGGPSTERMSHTLILLTDGTVLAAGGFNAVGMIAAAELYNPVTGAWTATNPMHEARRAHASVLLLDGRVLVAGGGSSGALSSAEAYDPQTKTWTVVGPLMQARRHPTATLLKDGKVLVAGGHAAASALDGAEIYDPSTQTWAATGKMAHPRFRHVAVRLDDGRVLVAGGFDGTAALSSTELYDPATGTWSPAGELTAATEAATVTLLPNGGVAVIGGENASTPQSSIQVWDPKTGVWSSQAMLSVGRSLHTATLLPSGKVLVAGGAASTNLSSTELWDPQTGTVSAGPTLSQPRRRHRAVRLPDGSVLFDGGEKSNATFIASSERVAENRGGEPWTPALTEVPGSAIPGDWVSLKGVGLRGVSTASGGLLSSASNHPVFILTRDGGEGAWFLPVKAWTETTATVLLPAGLPTGNHWLTVTVNGSPSPAQPLRVGGVPNVTPVAPVFVEDANLVASVGQVYRYNELGALNVTGSRPMTFSTCGAPAGFAVDAVTGAVSWTPEVVGTFAVCVSAENSAGRTAYAFEVAVTEDGAIVPATGHLFEVTLGSEAEGQPVAVWTEVTLHAEVRPIQTASRDHVWLKVELTGGAKFLPADTGADSNVEQQLHRVQLGDAANALLTFPVLVADDASESVTVAVTVVDDAGASLSESSRTLTLTRAPMSLPYGCSCDASAGGALWMLSLVAAAALRKPRRQRSSHR